VIPFVEDQHRRRPWHPAHTALTAADTMGGMASAAYRMVATDLDGTVVRSDGTISARTRSALGAADAAGAVIVLVTGRPPRWLVGIADQTGHRGMAICANGALVYDLATDAVVGSHPLPVETLRHLVDVLRSAIPGIAFAVERADAGFLHEPAYHPRWDSDQKIIQAEIDALLAEPAAKLLARHTSYDADDLLAAARVAVGDEAVATLTHSSRDGLLEISAAGVSKASALADLAGSHGIPASEVIAFGDMPNDLPMLAWAGHSVAVANAHPEVLEAADEVTARNDDDGVARVLEREFGRGGETSARAAGLS
jgi:Cof subfamily protein (haloacid dehalogenase superfamily)